MMRGVLAALCLMVLGACASLTQEECRAGDWASIGQTDGAEGRVADTQFARHVKACEKAGVTPDQARWQDGYARGLQTYCTPDTGLREGLAGRRYRDVCPAAAEARFLQGYDLGLADHDARARVEALRREISDLQASNRRILATLSEDTDTPLRWEMLNNQAEILRLQLELGFAQAEVARSARAVAAFRAR
jgi:hypothetical protein